jgi:hypothetical protein
MLHSKDRVEKRHEYKNHALGKMLESPVRYNIKAWCLADLETPDVILNLDGIG